MRIQFEIKEKFPEVIAEILTSEKWQVTLREENNALKRLTIKDPLYDSQAYVDIWEREIHIKTAWSNYTYRIFMDGNKVICEYIGAYRGLLEQTLLPQLTPLKNILDIEVLDTSISGVKKETLRNYGPANVKLRNSRNETYKESLYDNQYQDHPTVVQDEFIKEGIPMPSPYSEEIQ